MILDRYSIRIVVPRALYEDKAAFDDYLDSQWRCGIKSCGGMPADRRPHLVETIKLRKGRQIIKKDPVVWDSIIVFASGAAYRHSPGPPP